MTEQKSMSWDELMAPPLEKVQDLEQRDQQTRSAEAEALWAQLPEFMGSHMVIGLDPDVEDHEAEDAHAAGYPDHDVTVGGIEEADMIASANLDKDLFSGTSHRPVLDIDFPAALVPSTTPGHFHLYLDKPMSWGDYKALLLALARAGIIEDGYAQAALRRGYTSVRLPWIRKPEPEPTPEEFGHWVNSQPEGVFCGCGFSPDDAMDAATQFAEVREHIREAGGTPEAGE